MSTSEHLHEAEHTQHAAHDPFDRKVAMTMAIVAAALACMVMLSHRSHNDTLRLQSEAGILMTHADTLETQAVHERDKLTNQWNFYQAKNIRKHEYEAFLLLLASMNKDSTPEGIKAAKYAQDYWTTQSKKYDKELKDMQLEAKKLEDEVLAKQKESVQYKEKSDRKQAESHLEHLRAFRFDMGELGIEIALVLCSIAVLTKRASFWYSGIVIGSIGAVVGLSAFTMAHGGDDSHSDHASPPAATSHEH